jgi:hypothetical protein
VYYALGGPNLSKVLCYLHLQVLDLGDTPPTIYHLGGIPQWAWRLNTDSYSLTLPGNSRNNPFSTRLPLVLHQDSSGEIQFNLRNGSLLDYVTQPLFIRRPCGLSPSLHWRRIWIAYSRSEKEKPPHVRRLLSSTTMTGTLMMVRRHLWPVTRA